MSFKEKKLAQQRKDTANLGPGSYVGNDLSFSRDATNVLFSPLKPKRAKHIEISPGPANYQPKRADSFLYPGSPVIKMVSPKVKRSVEIAKFYDPNPREITPDAGFYDAHLKPFGTGA